MLLPLPPCFLLPLARKVHKAVKYVTHEEMIFQVLVITAAACVVEMLLNSLLKSLFLVPGVL